MSLVAEVAVIAWMRHQTTNHDRMAIPRVSGKRREIRCLLAGQCVALLDACRASWDVDVMACPLQQALPRRVAAARPASA